MSTAELKQQIIDKIQKTENESLLREAYRLLEIGIEDIEVYKLSADQLSAVNEARHQIKNGNSLSGDQADKEADEWLGE
jgi:hypothetical protein